MSLASALDQLLRIEVGHSAVTSVRAFGFETNTRALPNNAMGSEGHDCDLVRTSAGALNLPGIFAMLALVSPITNRGV